MFETCPPDPNCLYCSGQKTRPSIGGDVDAIYCINVQEQPKRFADACRLFHAEGLCGDVIFYRPHRGRHSTRAIWISHREVAREALRRGQRRVLVFEDDLRFLRGWASIVASIRRALPKLPRDWFGLYLGHAPSQAYFVAWGVLRASSSTTHAYIANRPLLDWLDATEPMDPYTPIRPWLIGRGVDSAFACLPGMFALFPMKVMQRRVEEARQEVRVAPRPWWDLRRYRLVALIDGMRPKEALAVTLSPLHWLLMRFARGRAAPPLEVQAEVRRRFDAGYYYANNPDVAASGRDALEHFFDSGSREGRDPNAWFDTKWYARTYGLPRRSRLTAFEHYLWRGRSAGHRPSAGAAGQTRDL